MLHPAIRRIQTSTIHGTGLVAGTTIKKDEIIWKREADMQVFAIGEVLTWPEDKQERFFWFAFQCDAETFIYTVEDDGYMNHSCDPNTWWLDDETLIARRDIAVGEEVTYDYATTEISIFYEMNCQCGTASCRGLITEKDHLNSSWQTLYGDHIPSFVKKAIAHAAQ